MLTRIQTICRHNWILITILLTALLFGLAIVIATGLSTANFGDANDYLNAAYAIEKGLPYPREGGNWPFFRPPGYPFAIATIWNITGISGISILKLLNVFCHVASSYLVFKISKLEIRHAISLFCAFLYAVNPFSLYQLSGISTEPLITFLFLAFAYLLLRKPTPINMVLISITALSCIATRPEYIFAIVPIIIIKSFWQRMGQKSLIRGMVALTVLTLALSFWGYSNKKATGDFIVMTDATNYQLWMGSTDVIFNNYPLKISNNDNFNQRQLASLNKEIQEHKAAWGEKYTKASVKERSDLWGEALKERVHSIGFLKYSKAILAKGVVFWRPFLSPASYSFEVFLLSLLIFSTITIFTIVGIISYWRKNELRSMMFIFCFTLGVLTIVHMLQMPDIRYRIPVFMPFTLIVSGVLTWEWMERQFHKSRLNTR
jgi:hypothetical protein